MNENPSKTEKSFLDYLKEIDLTASGSLTDKFREKAKEISEKEKLTLIFDKIGNDDFIHVSFSVKVSHTDGFIPYYHIHLNNDGLRKELIKFTNKTIKKNSSSQDTANYSTLIEELKAKMISFAVKKENGNSCFSEGKVDGEDDIGGKIQEMYGQWKEEEKNNFIDIFSREYWKYISSESPLYFDIRVFDSDMDGNTLTVILVMSNNQKYIKDFHSKNSYAIGSLISTIKTCYYINQRERKNLESIKSAIAALMARNMSHNLGSHYLTNTKNFFRRRVDALDVSQGIPDDIKNDLRADYRGNAHLLQYIQERMDFLATLVSTDRYPYGSLNFKAEFFDVLTEDDRSERHDKNAHNFLLEYLLLSEKLTRHAKEASGLNNVRLQVRYGDKLYTGIKPDKITDNKDFTKGYEAAGIKAPSELSEQKDNENRIKTSLSKLNLAVPGGLMARHALFTIVENIARNAAKHGANKGKDMFITIEIKDDKKGTFTLSIYDNWNGDDAVGKVRENFDNLKIIDFENNNIVDRTCKGLKEILICTLWLKNLDVALCLYEIQQGKKFWYEYLTVEKAPNGSLCYSIKDIPLFKKVHYIHSDDGKLDAKELDDIHADIIVAKEDYKITINGEEKTKKLSEIFPGFHTYVGEENDNDVLSKIGRKEVKIAVETSDSGIVVEGKVYQINDYYQQKNEHAQVVFLNHLGRKANENPSEIISQYKSNGAIYVDGISGENFTKTITAKEFLKDPFLRHNIIESAYAKIAIVDERIYDDYYTKMKVLDKDNPLTDIHKNFLKEKVDESDVFESFKNTLVEEADYDNAYKTFLELIQNDIPALDEEWKEKMKELIGREKFTRFSSSVKDLNDARRIYIYDMWEANKVIDLVREEFTIGNFNNNQFDFLSIHLGLIDKLCKGREQVEGLMNELSYKAKFVCIHSGRGDFSNELEQDLKDYAYVNLSVLQSALDNSKYLLYQLFHNINYYGKGNYNNHS